MSLTDDELRELLDQYDRLVMEAVTGQITFYVFQDRYGTFYLDYALDGHESMPKEQENLERYGGRITLHREITYLVILHITSEELLSHPDAAKHGFRGEGLAHKQLHTTHSN